MHSYGTSVLFVCRLCNDSFQIVDDFIEHKIEEHSVEFQTSNCIIFEDILILNTCNEQEKNFGMLSTVKEEDNPVPPLNVPLVGIKTHLRDVDISHSDSSEHDPTEAFQQFPISTPALQNDENHENQDDNETCSNSLRPNHDDHSEAYYDLPQASTGVSFNLIEPKTELTEFALDQKINWTVSNAMTQGPQNPYVLLNKLSAKEILNYSRLQNQEDTIQASAKVTFKTRCKLCLKKFNSEAELEIHCRVCIRDNNERDEYCSSCNKLFSSKWLRYLHKIRVHGGSEEKKGKLCSFKCKVCQKVFMKKDMLTYHIESHRETIAQHQPFKCDQCSASFYEKYDLTRHQVVHVLTRAFPCPEPNCGKAFKHKYHLKQHLNNVHAYISIVKSCSEIKVLGCNHK